MTALRLRVVRSRLSHRLVSLRTEDMSDEEPIGGIRAALTDAGYLPGDVVELTIVSRAMPLFEETTRMNARVGRKP